MREYIDFMKYIIVNSDVKNIEEDFVEQLIPEVLEYANAVVDLSHWNKNVNFKLAKEDGILGVIHKATQGIEYIDARYGERRNEAENEGLLWGGYHFGVDENGRDQANHFLETIGDDSKALLALDIEENKHGKNITLKQADDFVERIQEVTGRLPLIYGNANFLKDFSTPILTNCPLWIAKWGAKPTLPPGWDTWVLWQYTDGNKGLEPHEVEGIGKCDRNKFNGTLEELSKFWLSGEI